MYKEIQEEIINNTKKVERLTAQYEYDILCKAIQDPNLEIVEAYFNVASRRTK